MLDRSGVLFVFNPTEIEAKIPQVESVHQTITENYPTISTLPEVVNPLPNLNPLVLQERPPLPTQTIGFTKVAEILKSQTTKRMNIRASASPKVLGVVLATISISSLLFLFGTQVRLEIQGRIAAQELLQTEAKTPKVPMPKMVSNTFNPLKATDGSDIVPINTEFAIIIPKFNINSPVVASVNPFDSKEYTPALKKGVAHAKTSYFPNQDGSVYLFSHSTNYEWFVRDLNALFYNVKDLTDGDYVVIVYQGVRYTYEYKSREIVPPKNTAFILPVTGKRQLILQTCWPPGSTTQRLLVFADLVDASPLTP